MFRSLRLSNKSCLPAIRAGSNKRLYFDGEYYRFTRKLYRSEGIDEKDQMCVFDRNHVFQTIDSMLAFKVVLVKAPPFSSKTGTMRLFARYALNLKSYNQVFCLSGKSSLDEQISSQSAQNEPKNFAELLSTKVKTLVMIDEGHLVFDTAFPNHATLWGGLKDLMSNGESPLNVVVFASCGEKGDMNPTGIDFMNYNTLYFDDLSFAKSETQEMADKWNNLEAPTRPFLDSSGVDLMPKKMSEVVQLTSTAVNTIFTLTMGHVGLTRLVIELVGERFLDNERHSVPSYPVGEGEIMSFLLSSELQHALGHVVGQTSAVPSGWEPRDQEAVRRILMLGSLNEAYHWDLEDNFTRLKKIGLVANTGYYYVMFTSPLLAMQAMDTLFGTVPGRPTEMPQFEQFLFDTLSLMNHEQLKLGKVRSEEQLPKTVEVSLLMEWYCAAIRLLPRSCFPIVNYARYLQINAGPCIGQGDELDGLVDFYVGGADTLGVDVLRDSVDLKQQIQRFEVGGKLAGIPLSKWKVVNFVEVSGEPKDHVKKQKVVYDGELRILWSPDCVDFVALDSAGGEKYGKFTGMWSPA